MGQGQLRFCRDMKQKGKTMFHMRNLAFPLGQLRDTNWCIISGTITNPQLEGILGSPSIRDGSEICLLLE